MPTPTPSGTEFYWEWCNPLVVMLVLGLLILGAGIFFQRLPVSSKPGRARRGQRPEHKRRGRAPTLMPEEQVEVAIAPLGDRSPGLGPDRRTAMRRRGKPVKVHISAGEATPEPVRGWVIDRSRGGICVISPQELPVGHVLGIRAVIAPDDSPWVQVQVKNCRPKGRRWALGCQFTEDLPWAVLLLFG